MHVVCPECEMVVEISMLALMEDGMTRCPKCKAQITPEDLDPEVFSELQSGVKGGYKSGSELLKNDFDL